MSEEVTPEIPAVGQDGFQPFLPTTAQAVAKSRLNHKLATLGGVTDLASMTADEVVKAAADRRVLTWLRDPAFAAWFYDKDEFVHRATALKEVALGELEYIIRLDDEGNPKALSAKLKAIDMLLQLTGAYPGRRTASDALDDHLDKLLGKMSESETDSKLVQLKSKLAKTNT
jgi:hypothetical protein